MTTPYSCLSRPQRRHRPRTTATLCVLICLGAHAHATDVAQTAPSRAAPQVSAQAQPITAIASLNVPAYMGTWYQVAWFPNRFQKQCVSDTTATYSQRPDGNVRVLNRCKLADGKFDDVDGLARPANATLNGDILSPAKLEVSFLPSWLRWLPIWGSYWVIELAADSRYAVISESTREYLWVLARAPQLSTEDQAGIRARLVERGFDLSRWQLHVHTQAQADTGTKGGEK